MRNRWMAALGTAVLPAALLVGVLLVGGCSRPAANPDAAETARLRIEVRQLLTENEQLRQDAAKAGDLEKALRGQVDELNAQVAALQAGVGRPAPGLIDSHYAVLHAGSPGIDYVKSGSYDLDGDGTPEKLVVLTTAVWVAKDDTFAWDDGHNWQVYVEEPNGTRTYLFNRWVQMGRLTVMVTGDQPDVLIMQQSALSLDVYRVHYRGPEPPDARLLTEIPVAGYTGFTNPNYHD